MIGAIAGTLAVVALVVALGTSVGVVVSSWAPDGDRPIGMVPAVGLGALILWLGAIGLVIPPGSVVAVVLTVVVIVASAVATLRLRRDRMLSTTRELWGLAAPLLVGLVCALPFLVVIARARATGFVHLSGNHDGYFFVAIPQWLLEHTTLGGAGAAVDGTPLDVALLGSTWDVFWNGSWRIGSESFTAVIARGTGVSPIDLWMPLSISYLVVAVAAVQALARTLGAVAWRALVIAGVVGISAAMIAAIADQHTPTVLGLALLMALVAELLRGPTAAPTGASPLLVAVTAGGLAAVYSELFTLVLVPLAVLVLLPWWRARKVDGAWLGRVVLWSAVVALPTWLRAVVGLWGGNAPEGYHSAFDLGDGWFSALNAFARGSDQPVVTWAALTRPAAMGVVLFGVLVVVGLAAAIRLGPGRAWWAAMAVSTVCWWALLGTVDRSGYPQQRLVEWSAPLLLLGALLGWSALSERLPAALSGRVQVGVPERSAAAFGTAVFVVAAFAIAAPGLDRARRVEEHDGRRVDGQLQVVDDWIRTRDRDGSATLVLANEFMPALWVPYVLGGLPRTAYLNVHPGYFVVDRFGDATDRRWLLLDRQAMGAAEVPDGAVVESNERFALVDLEAGDVVLTVPPDHDGRWADTGRPVTVRLTAGTVDCTQEGAPLECG